CMHNVSRLAMDKTDHRKLGHSRTLISRLQTQTSWKVRRGSPRRPIESNRSTRFADSTPGCGRIRQGESARRVGGRVARAPVRVTISARAAGTTPTHLGRVLLVLWSRGHYLFTPML